MADATQLSEPVLERLVAMRRERDELDARLSEPEVAADHRVSRDLAIRKASLDGAVQAFTEWERLKSELAELASAAQSDDPDLREIAREETPEVQRRLAESAERLRKRLVNSDDEAIGSIILEVRAGTGGDEAGLWARDLLTMYQKFAQSRGWSWEELSLSADASLGGVRHAVIGLSGEGVWSAMAFEAGVHSVKRVPATEAQGRIHTSTATVAVLPEAEEVDVKIDWAKDVVEHVTTSQGPGGQNVNKVATAVHLVHTPTGVEVRMQESKSQAQNREKARRLLRSRVAEMERERAEAERAADRNAQIGSAGRSEKIRVYRYQDDITSDQRLEQKFKTSQVVAGDLAGLVAALRERETQRRLEAL